jgi:hypothetical protein
MLDAKLSDDDIMSKSKLFEEDSKRVSSNLELKNNELYEKEKLIHNFYSRNSEFIKYLNENCLIKKECIICMDREREIIFAPCGHFILCKECNSKIKEKCPYCNYKITGIINKVIDIN